MAKRPKTPKKPRLPGVDPIYVLAVKPKRGKRPNRFLADARAFPGEGPTTTAPVKARKWLDSSGPRHYFRFHPHLRKTYVAFALYQILVEPGDLPPDRPRRAPRERTSRKK